MKNHNEVNAARTSAEVPNPPPSVLSTSASVTSRRHAVREWRRTNKKMKAHWSTVERVCEYFMKNVFDSNVTKYRSPARLPSSVNRSRQRKGKLQVSRNPYDGLLYLPSYGVGFYRM